MKISKSYLALMAVLAAVGVVACSDDFDTPPMMVPTCDTEANISIYDLKTQYWSSDRNYIDTIGLAENGDSLYIRGRVISSDESGNIYNNLYIQDESGAICLSIRYSDMYTTYRIGQEVVMSVSGMYIGKYNGLQQFGYPDYSDTYGWQATFMSQELFESRTSLNGLPDASQIDTIVTTIGELPTATADLIRMQGQLVRFNNVHFAEADGSVTFSEEDSSTSRTLVDSEGNELVVRNSNYADFRGEMLPLGNGSVVGILSYYGTAWQLVLRDSNDCIGFSTDNTGTAANPYTIEQAIELQGAASGWVTGYIVGAVAPEVTEVKSNSDIEWEAPTTLGNTLVIGATPETRDYRQCIVMSLPQNSALRAAANLVDNPAVLGTQIWVTGKLESYMGTYGLTGNSGSTSEYKMAVATGGVAELYEDFEHNGSDPEGWTIIESGGQDWWARSFDNNYYMSVSGYQGTPPFNIWLISPALNVDAAAQKVFSFRTQVNGYGSTTTNMKVYVLSNSDVETATRTDVTSQAQWPTPPSSGYSSWMQSGDIDLSSFSGTIFIGFCYEATSDANYATWGLDDFRFGTSSGTTPTPEPPSGAVTYLSENFESVTAPSVPTGWTVIESGGQDWWTRNFDNNNYITATGYSSQGTATPPFNIWLITPALDADNATTKAFSFRTQVNGYGSTTTQLKAYVLTSTDPATATRTDVTDRAQWAEAPASGYSSWVLSGDVDLSAFSGTIYIGFCYEAAEDANYATWCIDDFLYGGNQGDEPGGGDDPDPTPDPGITIDGTRADFETFNGGSTSTQYGSFTTTDGWAAANCNLIKGTDGEDSNPLFQFIGYVTGSTTDFAMAACMNGRTDRIGTITSPTITGGCGQLAFNYGFPYTESNAMSFRVDVVQDGEVVKSFTVSDASQQKVAYTFTEDVNVGGDFYLQFTNLAPSQTGDANKDRVAIWNVTWTNL